MTAKAPTDQAPTPTPVAPDAAPSAAASAEAAWASFSDEAAARDSFEKFFSATFPGTRFEDTPGASQASCSWSSTAVSAVPAPAKWRATVSGDVRFDLSSSGITAQNHEAIELVFYPDPRAKDRWSCDRDASVSRPDELIDPSDGKTITPRLANGCFRIMWHCRGRMPTDVEQAVALGKEPPANEATPPDPPAQLTVSGLVKDPQYAFSKSNAEAFCKREWEKAGKLDREMYRYCVDEARTGHKEFVSLLKKNKSLEWIVDLLPRIWADWTKVEITDYNMVAHALGEQLEGYEEYVYLKKQKEFDATKMDGCVAEWSQKSSPWSMAVYCYKED